MGGDQPLTKWTRGGGSRKGGISLQRNHGWGIWGLSGEKSQPWMPPFFVLRGWTLSGQSLYIGLGLITEWKKEESSLMTQVWASIAWIMVASWRAIQEWAREFITCAQGCVNLEVPGAGGKTFVIWIMFLKKRKVTNIYIYWNKHLHTHHWVEWWERSHVSKVYGINWEAEATHVSQLWFHEKIPNGNARSSTVKGMSFLVEGAMEC